MTAFLLGLDVSRLNYPIDKRHNLCYNISVRKRGTYYEIGVHCV